MALRVFVVRELHPFTAGGIGRVAANMLAASNASELANTAIVYLADGLDSKRFHSVYPTVRFVAAGPRTYATSDGDGRRFPPASAYTDSMLHGESVRAMQALRRLEKEAGPLGYVEFGDWGANALASCQEKLLGNAFFEATLAVRLHSTDSVLAAVEGRASDIHALALYDLERKALADCDLIVAQLESVADRMKSFYDFADADWDPRVVIHAPPVYLDHGEVVLDSARPRPDAPIVFSSKLQRLKRPDIFVRGCVGFMRANPGYLGEAVFLAHAFDGAYKAKILRLVPADLAGRFRFVEKASQEERARTIASSVCVFPTIWESFCLAAYEASMAGARCIVNEANPAFDARSPWVAGVNCEKFDETPEALAASLARAFDPGAPVFAVCRAPVSPGPWERLPVASERAETGAPLVSVLVPHYNLGAYLQRTIDSVLTGSYTNVELVVVDDASTDPASIAAIDRLASVQDDRLRVIRAPFNRGLAATRNAGVVHCRGDFILPLDADDLIGVDFIASAVRALDHEPAFDFVVPQVAYFKDAAENALHGRSELEHCYVLIGEARASGLHENRFSTATVLARKSALRRLGYREELTSYEDWDMYFRAVASGSRFIVTNDVQFFYRVREDSMIHSAEGRSGHRVAYHDVLRDKFMNVGTMRLPLFAIQGFTADGGGSVAGGGDLAELRAKVYFYENSRVVSSALLVHRQLQRRAPWLLRIGRRVAMAALRIVRRLRR